MRSVDRGHFRDMTLDVATISESLARFCTKKGGSGKYHQRIEGPLTFTYDLLLRDELSRFQLRDKIIDWVLLHKVGKRKEFLCKHVLVRQSKT